MASLFKTKKSIRTIFFDIGGVIVDAPMGNYLELGCNIFGCQKKDLENATAQALPALETAEISSTEFWEKVSATLSASGLGQAIPAWKFKGFWESLLTDSFKVDRDMMDLVRRLKAHVRVAVLSNVIKVHAKILNQRKVYEHFNPVVLSCEIGLRKPDPEVYKKAAKLAKTPVDRCMLVDDSVANLEAAQKVGFRVLHFTDFEAFKHQMYTMGILDNG